MALHQILDPQHGNVVASAFEYPTGWQARSGMTWNFQDMSLPVKAYAQTYNAQGTECVEFLPNDMFFWLPEGRMFYQQGQSVMGQAFMPPMSCVDALKAWVVPKFRGQFAGVRVVRVGYVPILSHLGPQSPNMQGEEGCISLEYSLNGKLMEEEIYGVKGLNQIPYYGPQGMMVQTNWGFPLLFSFRAEKGQLDAHRDCFWKIVASLKLNPAWEQAVGADHAAVAGTVQPVHSDGLFTDTGGGPTESGDQRQQ